VPAIQKKQLVGISALLTSCQHTAGLKTFSIHYQSITNPTVSLFIRSEKSLIFYLIFSVTFSIDINICNWCAYEYLCHCDSDVF
jgi:hypothetical protein